MTPMNKLQFEYEYVPVKEELMKQIVKGNTLNKQSIALFTRRLHKFVLGAKKLEAR